MLTIKRIGILSLAKFLGILYGGIGFIIGLVVTLVSLAGSAIEKLFAANAYSQSVFSTPHSSVLSTVFGVGALIILPILYGLMGLVLGVIVGFIANLALRI
jgi:hypothetical protein